MSNILKRVGLAIVIVVLYFLGIRELRQEMHQLYMGTILPQEYGEINEHYSYYAQSSVSFTITATSETETKGWQFRIPFDSYWLFGTLILVLFGKSRKEYFYLSLIHIISGLITLCCVIIGLKGFDIFLITTDFICRYLIPLASLGYVSLIVGGDNSILHSHGEAS